MARKWDEESKLDLRNPGLRARLAELRQLERDIAYQSMMPGARYAQVVADRRPWRPYRNTPQPVPKW